MSETQLGRASKRDLLRGSSVRKIHYDPFKGSNAPNEIESFSEFQEVIKSSAVVQFVFQEVDFTEDPSFDFGAFHFERCIFLGCTFGADFDLVELKKKNTVLENNPKLPFKPFRAFLYHQCEMGEADKKIYDFYKNDECVDDITKEMNYAFHDFSIEDALYDYVEGKSLVSIMGGHGVQRQDRQYGIICRLGRKLAQSGFVVTTGGSTGAMEASNLGAYLFEKTEEEFLEALEIIAVESGITPQYKDEATPAKVVARFGSAGGNLPSLGIPTFYYGHEPSNQFCGNHGKFFSNAVREEALLEVW
jgi:hypothetical protein